MANVASVGTSLPIVYRSACGGGVRVTPVTAVIDTTNEDLTIYAPSKENSVALVGLSYSNAEAHTLTIKSGASDTLAALVQPANSFTAYRIERNPLVVTAKDKPLVISSDKALSHVLLYVAEFDFLVL